MEYEAFLESAITDAIADAKQIWAISLPHQDKLSGALNGLESCRHKSPFELRDMIEACKSATSYSRKIQDKVSWFKSYEAEVGWICNVISCWLIVNKQKPITTPTVRGHIKAQEIMKLETI